MAARRAPVPGEQKSPELNGWLSFDVVRDMLRYNLVRDAGSIRCPTLLITGDRDSSSTVYNNEKLFERLQCAKRLTILKRMRTFV